MHAIATVPRLYVQTLHLMNKMNLPPPFGPVQSDSIPDSVRKSVIVIYIDANRLLFFISSRLVTNENMMSSWRVMNPNLNRMRMKSKKKGTSRLRNPRSLQQQTRGNGYSCGTRNDDDCVWGRMKSFFLVIKRSLLRTTVGFFLPYTTCSFCFISKVNTVMVSMAQVVERECVRCNRHDAQLFGPELYHISDVQHLHVRCGFSKVNNL